MSASDKTVNLASWEKCDYRDSNARTNLGRLTVVSGMGFPPCALSAGPIGCPPRQARQPECRSEYLAFHRGGLIVILGGYLS